MFKCGKTFYLKIDDIRLHIYDSVEKCNYEEPTTLVFLHGFPGQMSNWKYQVRFFEQKYRVIVYDQRGFGKSDKPLKVSFENYISDLDVVLERRSVKVEDTIIVGHSFGAMIAQSYASRRNVKGLVLIGSLRKMEPDITDYIVWYLPSFIWKKIFFTENILTKRMYRNLMFSHKTSDKVFEEFIRDNREYLETLPSHVYRYSKYLVHYDTSKDLVKIRAPTLVIVGEHDKVTPPRENMEIAKLIPNSKIVLIKNAGHLVLYEKPEELNRVIHEFVKKISKK